MTLALVLHKTLAEIQALDTDELLLWQAFHDLYGPFDVPADVLTALTCTVLANCHRTKGRTFKIKDFLAFRNQRKQNTEDLRHYLRKVGRVVTK